MLEVNWQGNAKMFKQSRGRVVANFDFFLFCLSFFLFLLSLNPWDLISNTATLWCFSHSANTVTCFSLLCFPQEVPASLPSLHSCAFIKQLLYKLINMSLSRWERNVGAVRQKSHIVAIITTSYLIFFLFTYFLPFCSDLLSQLQTGLYQTEEEMSTAL